MTSVADAPAELAVRRRLPPKPRFDGAAILSVYVVILMLFPSRLVFTALGGQGTPAFVIGLAALVLWIAPRPRDAGKLTDIWPVRLVMGFYVGVALASYALAMTRALDPIEIRGADRALLSLASAAGVALCASEGIATRARLETLLSRLVIASSICAGIGLLQFFGLDLTKYIHVPGLHATAELGAGIVRSGFHRVAGTARHPIELGAALSMVLPLALHFAFRSEGRARWFRWGCVSAIGLAIPMSVSRTAILGVLVVAVVMIPSWDPERQRRALSVAAAWTVVMYLGVPGLIGTIKNLFANYGSDPSVEARTDRYKRLGGYLAHHTILGRGLGTWVPEKYFVWDNQYIVTVLEVGLVGLAALLLVMIAAIGLARGARRHFTDPDARDLAQSLAASAAVPLVVFATFDAVSFPMVIGLLFLVLGCSGALWRLSKEPVT